MRPGPVVLLVDGCGCVRSRTVAGTADKGWAEQGELPFTASAALPSKSIAYAQGRARQLVDSARSALLDLPDTEARRVLDTMAEFVISRPM